MTVSFQPFKTAFTVALLLLAPALAQQEDTSDWNVSRQGDTWTLTPKQLPQGLTFRMTAFPVTALKNQTLESWMKAFIQKDSTKRGKIISPLNNLQEEGNMLVGALGIETAGEQRVLLYAAIDAQEGHGQMFLLESSLNKTLSETYGPRFSSMVARAYQEYHPNASQSTTSARFALPAGAKKGGKLETGRYTCQTPGYQNQVIQFDVSLYDNGEYRLTNDSTGKWQYNPKTGEIDISVTADLYNSSYNNDTFSLFYRDKNNKPLIYAEDDGDPTLCLFAGKVKDLSPSAQEAADQKKREEERRFKYVTAPGKGVQMNQMEGLVLHYELQVNGLNGMVMQMPELALLLKDGTAYTGLRVPPEDLDIKASRKYEPDKWKKWKKNGKTYLMQEGQKWNDIGSLKVVPATKGEKISGNFKHMASSYSFGLGGTTFTTYYTFDSKSHFEVSDHSLSSTGGMAANNGFSSSASTTSDKEGTRSTVGTAGGGDSFGNGPAVVVTSQNNSNQGNPEKAGTYTLSGYTLQMKTSNGKVIRKLFFFFDSKKEEVWIEDSLFHSTRKE